MIVYGSDIVSWIRYQSCLCTFAFPHLFQPSLDKLQTGLDIYCPRDTLLFFCSCRFSLAALLHLASLIVFCCVHQLCSWYLACSCTISLPCFCFHFKGIVWLYISSSVFFYFLRPTDPTYLWYAILYIFSWSLFETLQWFSPFPTQYISVRDWVLKRFSTFYHCEFGFILVTYFLRDIFADS